MRIDFGSKLTYGYDAKYIKTKIKKNIQTVWLQIFFKKYQKKKCHANVYQIIIIMLDSVIKSDETYYPQTFLEKCKYVQEKIKLENYIDEELDWDSDDE